MKRNGWLKQYKDNDELKRKLTQLYCNLNLSLSQIAKTEKITVATLYQRMQKLGIPLREQHEWHHVIVNTAPSKDLSYVLGVLLGDGWVTKAQTKMRTTDTPFAESFRSTLKKIGFRPSMTLEKQRGYGTKPIWLVSGASVDFAKWYRGLQPHDIEAFVFCSREATKEFIRGFYESEGHYSIEDQGNPRAIMTNTNKKTVLLVHKAIESLGYKAYINGPYSAKTELGLQIFKIVVSRSMSMRFIQEISPCIKNQDRRMTKIGRVQGLERWLD